MPTKKETERVPRVNSPIDTFRETFKELSAPEKSTPTMVLKISELTSDELGDMISRYSAWREYTEDKLIAITAMKASITEQYKMIYNKAYIEADGRTISDKKILAETNDDVIKINKQLTEISQYEELFSGKMDSLSNAISTLSRELTRRGIISG